MSDGEKCRRCTSAALVATPHNDGTETVVCSTCGRRFRRVMRSESAPRAADAWWAE